MGVFGLLIGWVALFVLMAAVWAAESVIGALECAYDALFRRPGRRSSAELCSAEDRLRQAEDGPNYL